MTYAEFMNTYCLLCGTQRCTGPYDEVCREGCKHYRREILKEKEQQPKFVTCHVCKGTGVYSMYEQCPTCRGFGTVIVYEEEENETEARN